MKMRKEIKSKYKSFDGYDESKKIAKKYGDILYIDFDMDWSHRNVWFVMGWTQDCASRTFEKSLESVVIKYIDQLKEVSGMNATFEIHSSWADIEFTKE